ncbi:uncharacterized protein LOC115969778 [Quercus lobata]|uniref:uncharacterized protein LOC115969778 n=1 Tax=Quercus lobata TaxID=97700 RepID=UPI001247D938|nr:uncharacterized protein LOC115969778 [Quercus lobata]
MEGTSDFSTLKMLNHELEKLDCFDGTNFSRWKDKMKFLLTALKLFYVLDPNLMSFPTMSDEDTNEIKAQRKKRDEDELICRGHILNTLSNRLYDLYTSMQSPKEIWNALEAKYKTEKIEESQVRNGTNTDSKVNVSNVQSGSSSKIDKYLKVNKSGSGFKKNNSKNPNKDKKNRACFHYGKKGHYIHECKLLQNKKKDEEVHVCNNKEQFKTYDESSIEQQVLIGNHNKANILGNGIVEVKMSSSKMLILTNVFHVPDIKKNLVFANLLCKSGVKAVLESDKLILSKNGIFVEK